MDEPKKTAAEILESLKVRGLTETDIAALTERLASKREDFMELPEVGGFETVLARLDKLQETVDRIAAKLDAEESA
jgi:uncharacterized membrane protein